MAAALLLAVVEVATGAAYHQASAFLANPAATAGNPLKGTSLPPLFLTWTGRPHASLSSSQPL